MDSVIQNLFIQNNIICKTIVKVKKIIGTALFIILKPPKRILNLN